MVSDNRLQHDVLEELEFDPSVDHTRIGVTVKDGVVTLTGTTASYVEKLSAEAAARRVAGVRAIVESMEVHLPHAPPTGDGAIAKRIVDVFGWDSAIPKGIEVKVEDGWVTLTGEVDLHCQSEAASQAAARIEGVCGVTNLLLVRGQPSSGDIHSHIAAAFRRSADVDASKIQVAVDGGTVTLSGRTRTFHERIMAEHAAWTAPGVTKVEDKIVLAG